MADKIIGVLTPVLDGFYYGNLLKSISQKAKEHHVGVVVIGTSARYYKESYASDYVDGWIVIMDAVDDSYIQNLRSLGKPVVGINTLLDVDYMVSINNREIMDKAVVHLMSHGHKHIAFIGDTHFYDAKERYQGYLTALQKHGLEYSHGGFYDVLQMNTYEIAASMVEEGLPFSAVVVVNDVMAIELINHFKTLNVRVPEDIAVIGIDDVPMARSIRPALSTFQLPIDELGFQAAEILLQHLWNETMRPTQLSAKKVYRSSCGCRAGTKVEMDDPTETVQYLGNMMSRNFNLGVLMQSYKNNETTEMNWLFHTPFRRGVVGLNNVRSKEKVQIYQFNLDSRLESDKKRSMEPIEPPSFPPFEIWKEPSFLGDENVIVIVPVVLEEQMLGVMALVGLGDISTELSPFNTTFQLANFFASALVRESIHSELQTYSQILEIISNLTHDGIWDINVDQGEISVKGGIFKALGYSQDQIPTGLQAVANIIHMNDLKKTREVFKKHHGVHNPSFEAECRCRHFNGTYVWMQINGNAQYDHSGKMVRVVGSVKDISERKLAEERISQLAYSDPLTGLANRLFLEQEYTLLLDKARVNHSKLAVLLLDLDRFKLINDSYGHLAGDQVLRYVAEQVSSLVKKGDLVARIGGDEFEVVMPNVRDGEAVLEVAEKIVERLNEPFYDGGREYYISGSIGIALYPDHGEDAETLTRHADLAMYQAKETGNRCQLFSLDTNIPRSHQLDMENDLRKALARQELIVYYQPQYDLSKESIYGVEALLRWNSPKYGFVSPEVFIPIAESTGLIITICEWVLREACLLSSQWRQRDESVKKVSVNISAKQLNHPHFVNTVKQVLAETGCNPGDLCLEITESMMLIDVEYSMRIVKELIETGVIVSIDDFGTGYSSLSLIKNFPISVLKIDKSFIDDMTVSEENKAIVHAIIKMSQIMSLKVVAEGVETLEQLNILKDMGVDYIQGYYISKPLPIKELELFIAKS
ncbi:MAG: EAL domain-containing protein [Paenibacillus sp.]|nr:EAL domain-containing protein [Paenibacillus sp.]